MSSILAEYGPDVYKVLTLSVFIIFWETFTAQIHQTSLHTDEVVSWVTAIFGESQNVSHFLSVPLSRNSFRSFHLLLFVVFRSAAD